MSSDRCGILIKLGVRKQAQINFTWLVLNRPKMRILIDFTTFAPDKGASLSEVSAWRLEATDAVDRNFKPDQVKLRVREV